MRRITVLAVLVTALGLAACGTKSVQSNSQAQADVTKAEKIFQHCVPDVLSLRSHAGRQKAIACAVPKQNRVPFQHCVTNGLVGHIPTAAKLENVFLVCVGKYA